MGVSVDEDGDPKVQYDDEDDPVQRFGKEFIITEKRNPDWAAIAEPKKEKKKKRKKSTSSDSSSEIDSDDSWAVRRKERRTKRSSVWGHSALERMYEDKRRAEKFQKKFGYNCDAVEKKTTPFANFDTL